MENITIRKKHRSYNDLTSLSDSSEAETSLNLSHNSTIKSLPNTYSENEEICHLKTIISQLKLDLEGAHMEIEHLSLENSDLNNQLTKYKKKLDLLKQIGVSENLCKTPISQEKRLQKRKISKPATSNQNYTLDTKPDPINCNKQLHYNENTPNINVITNRAIPSKETNIVNNVEQNNNANNTSAVQIQQNVIKKHKVIVLSDHRSIKYHTILQDLLGSTYDVFCFSKPGACLSNIVTTLSQEIANLSKQDFIVLLGGTHDKNPYELKMSLGKWLKSIPNATVLICQTPYNKYLNERKLNYEIKYECNMNKNAIYIDMCYDISIPTKNDFFHNICTRVLKEILHVKYKQDYETYVKDQILKKQSKERNAQKSKITFYFKNIQNQEEERRFFRS